MLVLGDILWTTPLMIAGAMAATVPVIAHLLNRRARRRVVLPTVRFVAEVKAGRSRMFRARRPVLMALRVAAVVLLALGFARPWWTEARVESAAGGGAGGASAGEGESVVIVLDRSASMRRVVAGVSLWSGAVGAADETLSGLRGGVDRANIVAAAGRAETLFPRLSGNIDGLRDELRTIGPGDARAAIGAALGEAGRMLSGAGERRRIVVVSDFQRTNWADAEVERVLRELADDGAIVEVRRFEALSGVAAAVMSGGDGEVSLSRAMLNPVSPAVGSAARALVRVTKVSGGHGPVWVELENEGRLIERRSVDLAAGESAEVSFDWIAESAGVHRLTFATHAAGDPFNADDRAYLAVSVTARPRIVIVSDDDADRAGSDAFYLSRALERDATVIGPADAAGGALEAASVIVIGRADSLDGGAAAAIARRVERGAGLVVLSEGERAGAVQASLIEAGLALPMRGASIRLTSADGEARRIGDGAWEAAAMRRGGGFDLTARSALSEAIFTRTWLVTGRAGDTEPAGGSIILRFDDGTPALALSEPADDGGRIAVASFGVGRESGDLARRGIFVALLDTIIRAVQQPAEPAERFAGRSVTIEVDESGTGLPAKDDDPVRPLTLLRPDGARSPVLNVYDGESPGRLLVEVARTDAGGHYSVWRGDRLIGAAAVNVDPRESDPESLTDTELSALIGQPSSAGIAARQAEPVDDDRRPGHPLWPALLTAALTMLLLEAALLSIWNR